ncbi:MAG: hypothetical protein ACK5DE_14815 [Bacteroidota bacterium]
MSLPQSSKQEGTNLKAIREQFDAVYPMAQRYVEYFAPDYAHKKDLKKDITHVLITSPSNGSTAEANAIRHILRVRGRASYVRPIAEKKNYLAKQLNLSDAELQDLPEMERMAMVMRDRLQLDATEISNLLQINQNQLLWLYFNADCILGSNRVAGPAIETARIPTSELNTAWIYYAAAFHAQPLQKSPGVLGKFALTYVSITLVALLGLLGLGQLYLNLQSRQTQQPKVFVSKKQQKTIANTAKTTSGEQKPSIQNAAPRATNRSIVSLSLPKNTTRSNPKTFIRRSSVAPAIPAKVPTNVSEIDEVTTVETPTTALPNAIGIHSQQRFSSLPSPRSEFRRLNGSKPLQRNKYGLFARIGMNSMRMHSTDVQTSGSIALGMKINIQSRIALRASLGISHLAHKTFTTVQRQYQLPALTSPAVVDSIIYSGLRIGQLHVSQEMQVTKNIIVHAGGIVAYRMANMGKSYTSNSISSESNAVQTSGVIDAQQTYEFASFNREVLYSRILGGVCAGISWRPPLLSHKMLLRAEFNYLPLYRRVNGPVPIARSAEMQLILEI